MTVPGEPTTKSPGLLQLSEREVMEDHLLLERPDLVKLGVPGSKEREP